MLKVDPNDYKQSMLFPELRVIGGNIMKVCEIRPSSSIRPTSGGNITINDIGLLNSIKERYEADIRSLKNLCDEKSKTIDLLNEDRNDLVNRIDELESGEASPSCEIDHALGHCMAVHKKFPDFDIEVFKDGKLLVGIRTNSMNCMIINL